MGLGDRMFVMEQELKIMFGLIYINHNLVSGVNKDLAVAINNYFKFRYYAMNTSNSNNIIKMGIELNKIYNSIKKELSPALFNSLKSYTTERYDNSNAQLIEMGNESIVVPDPELINDPKFANL
ncbi:MAG: hypothetical protein V1824_02240 [archaeon]